MTQETPKKSRNRSQESGAHLEHLQLSGPPQQALSRLRGLPGLARGEDGMGWVDGAGLKGWRFFFGLV